jgi:ubiquinone/menaquinone biosynthesis C-methylase UbiE
MCNELKFTGERFVPGAAGEIWYEHWHRHHFAAALVAGRDVLDVDCGEGYGSALLARNARRVTGADIAQTAIDHARARYASIGNVEFRQANCTALPFPNACFDTVASFETIDHVTAQEAFLDEGRRVLRPAGLVVLSSPNKVEYTDKRGVTNEFNVRELYRDELAALLAPRFPRTAWYGQRPNFYSVVWPEQGEARGEIFEVPEAAADTPAPKHARPLDFIVVGSAAKETVTNKPPWAWPPPPCGVRCRGSGFGQTGRWPAEAGSKWRAWLIPGRVSPAGGRMPASAGRCGSTAAVTLGRRSQR